MNKAWITARVQGTAGIAAVLVAAALMVVSGLVHVHLWDIAYRHVATLGPLFVVQAVAALVAAVVLAVTRLLVVGAASVLLMAGTIVGFVLAATVGIFGFTLPEVTGWAYLALATELLSIAILATLLVRQTPANSVSDTTSPAG